LQITLTAADPAALDADLLVVGAASIPGDVAALDARFGGTLAPYLQHVQAPTRAGASTLVPGLGHVAAPQIAVVGLGDGSPAALDRFAGEAGSVARKVKARRVVLQLPGPLSGAALERLVAFVAVGNYRYEPYLPEARRTPALEQLTLAASGDASLPDAAPSLERSSRLARWQAFTRDLVNQPPADLTPATLAAAAQDAAAGLAHVTVEVWDAARCEAEGLVGILAVGQGSAVPPCLIHLRYDPPGATDHVALVGKGVTFDAGGLSLKPTSGMQTMRCDMGGAATALGAIAAAADLGLPVRLDAWLPAVENLVSGTSFKLGDILRYRNGVTVEIHNTDAEGRLILADALILASETEGVRAVVDLATLTGAIVMSLGSEIAGLFTDDDALAADLIAAADAAGELLWRQPLHAAYKRQLKGTWGQIKNVGGREGGSITAALYLQHFVKEGVPWAHLDIAGTAFADKPYDAYVAGGTGQGVRALVAWLERRVATA
jgi:leucyl aminopeptidase